MRLPIMQDLPDDFKLTTIPRVREYGPRMLRRLALVFGKFKCGSPAMLAEIAQVMSSDLNELLATTPMAVAGQHACRVGCSWCCWSMVAVTVPEAVSLVGFLKKTTPRKHHANLLATFRQNADQAAGLSADEYTIRCAALTADGKCGAYPARPLRCRSHSSMDAKACEFDTSDPSTHGGLVPVDGLGDVYGQLSCLTIGQVLEHFGYDGALYELHGAVVACWSGKAVHRYLSGKRIIPERSRLATVAEALNARGVLNDDDGMRIEPIGASDEPMPNLH